MNDDDLENSLVVDGVTWVLYLGWMAGLVGLLYWFGLQPLPSIAKQVGEPYGPYAAVAAGVIFLVASRALYDHLKRRAVVADDDAEDVPEPAPEASAPRKKPKKPKKKHARR